MFQFLLPLLTKGLAPQGLGTIVRAVTGGNVQQAAIKLLRGKVDAQAGRTSGKTLGRAVCEQIDAVMEATDAGLDLEQRIQVGKALAQNAALQCAQAGEEVMRYADLQAAVVRAKAGAGDLSAARKSRDAGTEKVKQQFTDIGRVAAGDTAQEE